jgi:hypothetical protein
MWVKVDDGLPEHRKVVEAGRHLGSYGAGRVVAIWTVGMCYSNRNLTDGFIAEHVGRTWILYDRRPIDVLEVMALAMPNGDAGLIHKVTSGYQFHDYLHYQPSAAGIKEKRDRDRKRKRGGADSYGNPSGIAMDSAWIPERSRARDPDPDPIPSFGRKITAADAARFSQPVENNRVLKALIWREVHAAYRESSEPFVYSNVLERVKRVASRAGLVYGGEWMSTQVETAFDRVPTQHRSPAA